MENQQERSHSPHNKLSSLLSKVLQTVQNPQYNEDPSNYDPIISLLRSNRFFRTKLEPPANLHDFVQIAKLHINYEVHPYGTVLMKENDLADKLYIILKGDIAKLQQRANKILDKEVQEKRQENPRWDNNDTRHLFKSCAPDQSSRRPRIKRTVTRLFNSAVSIPSLREEDNEISQLKEKIHGTLTNLDARTPKARRAGLRITLGHIGHSLEDLDQEEEEEKLDISKDLEPSIDLTRSHVKFESSEDDGKFSGRPSFRRLDTLSQSEINNITRNNTEEAASTYRPKSLADWDGEDPESAGVVEEPQDLDDEKKFFKYIAAKHPNIKHRMFINEVVRIERTKKYTAGESFGENFYKPQQPRENAIMAVCSKQVHVLTLTRVSYRAIMAEIVHQSYDKGVFFTQLFPSFNKELIEKFSHYFSQDSFRKGEIIYKQDDRSKRLYVLQKGDITLTKQTKKVTAKTPQNLATAGSTRNLKTALPETLELPVASITKNQFFGEEVLMHKESRQYTATVKASETTAFFIDNKTFNRIQEGFNDLMKMLRDQAFERFAWREQRTVDLLGQKQLQTPKMKNNRSAAIGGFFMVPIEKQRSHPISTAVTNNRMILPSPAKMLPPLDLQSPKKGGVDFAEFPDLDLQRQISDPNSLFYTRTNLNKTVSTNELSTLRNLETYKTKFSRKVLEDPKGHIRLFDSSFEHTGSKTTTNAFRDFNVRKELQETTPTKYKLLPKVPATNQMTARKEQSAVKSRVLRLTLSMKSVFEMGCTVSEDYLLSSWIIKFNESLA